MRDRVGAAGRSRILRVKREVVISGDIFEGIKQWEYERDGTKFLQPGFYRDNASITAVYTASSKAVRNLLPHPDMHPVELSPGRCMVAFTAFEYKDSDIGPYNEFSIAFLITFQKRQIPLLTALRQMITGEMSAYVWQLPVTTELARVGGVVQYGYPKFLADIAFETHAETISCKVREGGSEILTLEGKILQTSRGKKSRSRSYSLLDGIPLVTTVLMDYIEQGQSRDKDAARLALGSHDIADQIRQLDLSEAPASHLFSHDFTPFSSREEISSTAEQLGPGVAHATRDSAACW